jgi:multidrug resistance efflux pump
MARSLDDRGGFAAALAKLDQLRRFAGATADFWRLYLEALQDLTGAAVVTIVRRRSGDVAEWRRVVVAPESAPTDAALREFWLRTEKIAQDAAEGAGGAQMEWVGMGARRSERAVGVRLEADREGETWVAILHLPVADESAAGEALRRLQLVVYLPAHFQLRRMALHLRAAENGAVAVLDLVALLNRTSRFVEAAMALCNELAARHRCDRVSLGWEKGGYVQTRAVSHTDHFVRKMEAVQSLEAAMEECFDQEEALVWPLPPGDDPIARDHAAYAAAQGARHLCSVPLRVGERPVGVVVYERQTEAFEEEEVRDLVIAADLAGPRLQELERRDRWFGARLAASAKERFAILIGPRHTWAKVAAVVIAVATGFLLFGKTVYRVEAPYTLRVEPVSYLTAPFNGFIREVRVEPGAAFAANDALLALDTRDLHLEEAGALADRDRFERESEKAQAENALADMRVAQAQTEQARVRLQMVRQRLAQATILAPYAGYVVEGDLKQRIGAPVRQGDVLFRVSQLEAMYVEARVSERDVQDVRAGAAGEIAFASQPKLTFPMRVVLVEPVAVSDPSEGNVFVVRCALTRPRAGWWRPGMTGLAKIEGERRTFFWIFLHSTIDYLRLKLWW